MSNAATGRLKSWGPFLSVWGPIVLVILVGFWVASKFVEPAPPKHAVIITGAEDGAYFAVAKKYAEIFKANGIELTVRPSAGSVDNYRELLKPGGDVDLAIVQGGTLPSDSAVKENVEGIASLYLEPLWVFYRSDETLDRLSQLKGMRIAVGAEGSGTRALAHTLFPEFGLPTTKPSANTTPLPISAADVPDAFTNAKIDAALIVAPPTSPVIHDLLSDPTVKLMSFSQAMALSRTYPFLSATTLYRGSVDLKNDLPGTDVQLVAPAAMLVARESAHKSLVLLGAISATQVHKPGTLLNEPGQFPSARYVEVPMAKEAQHYLDKGPSVLQRIFPFWLASFLDRMLIMLLPLATLLIPLVRFAPPLYVWRTRARIYRWYREIRAIDEQMGPAASPESMRGHLKQIERIDHEVRSVHVPLSYMQELYQLRMHLNLLEEIAKERMAKENVVGT